MLTLLKQYKKIITILFLPYLYILFILVMPTEKQIIAPGDLTPMNETVHIEGIEISKGFHTIYVYSYAPMTPFQGLIANLEPSIEVDELTYREKDTSARDNFLSGQVSKLSSLQIAVIKAYELANKVDENIEINYHFEGLMLYYRPSRLNELKIGDEILSINSEDYHLHDEESFTELSKLREATLSVRRKNGSAYEYHTISYRLEEDEPTLLYYPNYAIDHASPSFSLPGLESVIGGPSGGMIQTLSIYASLLKLNIGDTKIAGTGTIEIDGNIGRIGGIRQKIYTAKYRKTDLFFIPKSHENEIIEIPFTFDLIAVNTIEEAVQALYEAIN